MKRPLDVPKCVLEVSPVPFRWSCKMSSVILCCELEVWTYQRYPDEHSNDFAVDVMSIWIQWCILLCWRSPQRWCSCWIDVVVEVHVLQHAVVVGPFQTDSDVHLDVCRCRCVFLCCVVRTVECFKLHDCRSCSRNNDDSLDVPAMSKLST